MVGLFGSFAFIVVEIPDNCKGWAGVGLGLALFLIYAFMWARANFQNKTTLSINNSTVIIKTGDIFEEDGLKVIAFNEYFDTQVDAAIIARNSLNGRYINSIGDVGELDKRMEMDVKLNAKTIQNNESRASGKKKKYALGTVFQNDDYLLTALTKFDNDNRAYLSMSDYINFLLNFWNEIDIIYAGRSVSRPLLGSGITRFKGYDTISEQELLELLIWSFKITRAYFITV